MMAAIYQRPHPIRGGIPICFPKFYDYGCLEGNGFARTRMWNAENSMDVTDFPYPTPDNAYVDLIIDYMPDAFPNWTKHRLELRLRVILGPAGDLTMTSRVKNINTNGKPFSFKFSYLTPTSPSQISVQLGSMDWRWWII
ncbi:hypothetical protein ABFS83_11G022600 [Erythranthe nasuta]